MEHLIDSFSAAQTFANAIVATTRPYDGWTAPGSAINFASGLFDTNGYNGTRKVIDVSGDGTQNVGADTNSVSRAFCKKGGNYAINGIAILGSESGLDTWYANNIQCGTNSFTVAADGFGTFESAIKGKLVREITGDPGVVPLPAAGWLLIAGIGGLAAMRRRKS